MSLLQASMHAMNTSEYGMYREDNYTSQSRLTRSYRRGLPRISLSRACAYMLSAGSFTGLALQPRTSKDIVRDETPRNQAMMYEIVALKKYLRMRDPHACLYNTSQEYFAYQDCIADARNYAKA